MGTHSGALGEVEMERGTKKYRTVKNTEHGARIQALIVMCWQEVGMEGHDKKHRTMKKKE